MSNLHKYEARLILKITKMGVTRKKFCKMSGIALNTLINVNEGNTTPHQSTIAKIEKTLLKLKKRAAK